MSKKIILPLCIFLFLLLVSFCEASSVSRTFSKTAASPLENINVNLTVSITVPQDTYYAIDESYPSGWTLISASGDTNQSGHIKWVIIQGAVNTNHTYVARAPAGSGTYTFSGLYMFNTTYPNELPVSGQNQVVVGTGDTTPPTITFVAPTPNNNTNMTGNYIQVNVSLSEAPGTCLLNWYNGTWTNLTMAIQGLSCYRNMTSLGGYLYQFRVYASDAAGNLNVSAMRQNRVFSKGDVASPGGSTPDGCIDIFDLSAVALDFGKTSGFANPNSDINKDGSVNIFDLVYVGKDFGSICT